MTALVAVVGFGLALALTQGPRSTAPESPPMTPLAAADRAGYWLVAADGGIFSFGPPFFGSTGDIALNQPIVGMAAHPDGLGYWLVAADGGVFSFGSSVFHGSTGDIQLNQPIVGMAPTPSGGGYWLVAQDGGIFAFGDAPFFGSTGDIVLNQPIVGMAAHPDGLGYWFVAADGGVFSFGSSVFHGSMGATPLNQPIVGMATTPSGGGYWLVAADGGIFSFGDAQFFGSTGDIVLNQPIVGMAAHPDGLGYWFVAADGGVFSFGSSVFHGSMGATPLNQPIVGMATGPVPNAAPSLAVTGGPGNGAVIDDTTPTYSGTASDPDGDVIRVEVRIDDGLFSTDGVSCAGCAGGDVSWSFTPADLGDGARTFAFRAVDDAGVASAVVSRSVTIDTGPPSVTVEQAEGQSDPTNDRPILFTAQFSEPVSGFTADDVSLGGTAGADTVAVDEVDGATYTLSVSGMASDGTVTASIPAGAATDAVGNENTASTSDDNTVTLDETAPSVTVSAVPGQADPTDETPIAFRATFLEAVEGFTAGDVDVGGTAGADTVSTFEAISPSVYRIEVTGDGMVDGTVTVSVPAGAATDLAGNPNTASNEASVRFDLDPPRIVATALTFTDGANNEVWAQVDDVLTVRWSENVTHSEGDEAELTADQVNAILGTDVDVVYGAGSTVTLNGSGTDTWTLTIGGADLATGVAVGDPTNGTDNEDVTDDLDRPQVATTGVTLDVGPYIDEAAITNDVDGAGWHAVGDELTITWTEPASFDGDCTADEAGVNALLGTEVAFGEDTVVTLDDTDPGAWTLTIGGEDLDEGVEEGDDTNGTNNACVIGDDGGNPQVPTSGEVLVDLAGPQILATRLQDNIDGETNAWDAVDDVIEVTWTEEATFDFDNTDCTINDILGTEVVFAEDSVILIGGSGTATWTLALDDGSVAQGVVEGELTNGTDNACVTDDDGNTQDVATVDVMFGVGPYIVWTQFEGDGTWDGPGEELVVTWSEEATHSGDVNALTIGAVEAILGVDIDGAAFFVLGGNGTGEWTLTIVGNLSDGVGVGETTTNGTNDNDDVTDDDGHNQVANTGVVLSDQAPPAE